MPKLHAILSYFKLACIKLVMDLVSALSIFLVLD